MQRFRSVIAGMVLAAAIAGCGSTVDEGAHNFTPTDTSSLKPMLQEMQDKMKKKDYTKKAVPSDKEKKESEKK